MINVIRRSRNDNFITYRKSKVSSLINIKNKIRILLNVSKIPVDLEGIFASVAAMAWSKFEVEEPVGVRGGVSEGLTVKKLKLKTSSNKMHSFQ